MKRVFTDGIEVDGLVPFQAQRGSQARALGVTRKTLNNLANERNGVSPEMAIRLEKAFGSFVELWLRLQSTWDLAEARRREDSIMVVRLSPKAT